jgi:hypothetical protein
MYLENDGIVDPKESLVPLSMAPERHLRCSTGQSPQHEYLRRALLFH